MDWKHPGRSGSLVYLAAALTFGAVATLVTRMTVAGQQGRRTAVRRLPEGPVIIISNHASHVDGLLLALVCRRMGRSVRLLATAGVFRAPGIGRVARALGFIRVERGSASAARSLDAAAEALRAGEAVAIFPEGRTTRDPERWPERAKTGAVRLALRTGVPIVPVALVGTHRVLDKQRPVRTLLVSLILRPRVLVDVGEPIDVTAMVGTEPLGPAEVRELADRVMGRLVELVAELRDEPAPHPTGADPVA